MKATGTTTSMCAALAFAILALARPALAEPTCDDQLRAYRAWAAPIAAEVARGAAPASDTAELFAIPLRRTAAPQQPAMTLVVDAAGVRDGAGPVRPASEAAALIAANRNIAFARTNKSAIARGILVAPTRQSSASDVRAALDAAVAAGEPVWLVFRPKDRKGAAPPRSSVSAELGALDAKDVMGMFEVVKREFGRCGDLMAMMQKLANQTASSRLTTLTKSPRPALARCGCTPKPKVVAAILWKLAFEDLAVLEPVSPAMLARLSWGKATSRWQDVAPAIVETLRAAK